MQRARLLVTLSICLWYALQAVMFVIVRPELAYSFGHWLRELHGDLPGLTAVLSLAVLGPEISSAEQSYSAFFWVTWGLLLLPPLLLLGRAWTAKDRMELLEYTVYWSLPYLLGVAILGALVGMGLWLPFSLA